MRTIKFKAKRIDNGEWVEGSYLLLGHVIITTEDIFSSAPVSYSIDPETVCQFTGLYDKDRKEIWEGDIINYEMHNGKILRGTILWDEETSSFSITEQTTWGSFPHWKFNKIDLGKRCTVIGNIHDKEAT